MTTSQLCSGCSKPTRRPIAKSGESYPLCINCDIDLAVQFRKSLKMTLSIKAGAVQS